MSFYDAIRVGASGAADFEVERSLRFNRSDEAYLEATLGNSNLNKWTLSVWVKKPVNGEHQAILASGDSSTYTMVNFGNSDRLKFTNYPGSNAGVYITTRKFTDPGAWYHIVAIWDSGNSTAGDRIRIYVNGVRETAFDQSDNPNQNQNSVINGNTQGGSDWGNGKHRVGRFSNYTDYTGCYYAEVNFVDGQAYDPSYFAETNSDTGQWIPKKPSVTYGTNGFRLNFSDNSGTTATTLGKDLSGNGNNFTLNNLVTGDSVKDTPTNNFATLRMMGTPFSSGASFAEGNLKLTTGSSGSARNLNRQAFAPMLVNSGKWYAEFMQKGSTGYNFIGVGPYQVLISTTANNTRYAYLLTLNGEVYKRTAGSETNTTHGSSASQYDVIGVYLNMDASPPVVYFSKNGQWADGSGNFDESSPTSAVTLGDSFLTTDTGKNDGFATFILSSANGSSNAQIHANFGQDSTFAGQTTAGGNTDENGFGDFKYAVPTGVKALCSANLPDPTILLPNKHFDTLLWTANASTQSITGLNFSPDWVWGKSRDDSYDHEVYDTVRGPLKRLKPNATDQELTNAGNLTSFDSNGFTLGSATNMNYNSGSDIVGWNWNAGDTDGATYRVVVVSDSGNKYRFRNSANTATFAQSAVTLDLAEGGTYIFNMDDSTNASHPFSIGTAANGTVYTSGITYFLDGVSKTYSEYTSGFAAATTRRLHITVPASAPVLYYWCSAHSGMGGQINTNSTLGSSNFDGDIQSTVKANTTAGFSIVTYTGNGSGGSSAKIGHGLGVAPKMLLVKNREAAQSWELHAFEEIRMYLNDTDSDFADAQFSLTSTDIRPANNNARRNENGTDYVAYVFSEVAGYSKFGLYRGNGNADGTFIFTGFRPAFFICKATSFTKGWRMTDSKRATFNTIHKSLFPELTAAEYTATGTHEQGQDFLSNGVKLRNTNTRDNQSGSTYFFMAFAESPFKNSRAR